MKEIRRDSFNVAGTSSFANGDGLCFLGSEQEDKRASRQVHGSNNSSTRQPVNSPIVLHGFRVNRAVGNRLYPYKMPHGLQQLKQELTLLEQPCQATHLIARKWMVQTLN